MSAATEVTTYTATLYVGLRIGYSDRVQSRETALDVIQAYCDEVGLCVTVTDTLFLYSRRAETPHGYDVGFAVGFINYPRFPSQPDAIRKHATQLGERLKTVLGQNRVTVVCPDTTLMVGEKA